MRKLFYSLVKLRKVARPLSRIIFVMHLERSLLGFPLYWSGLCTEEWLHELKSGIELDVMWHPLRCFYWQMCESSQVNASKEKRDYSNFNMRWSRDWNANEGTVRWNDECVSGCQQWLKAYESQILPMKSLMIFRTPVVTHNPGE